MRSSPEVTELLERCRDGDERALDAVFPLVYDALHGLAEKHLGRERAGHTLQPTALVHEAYLRLVDEKRRSWRTREHFLGVAAMAMRRILINHAHRRNAVKRGEGGGRVTLFDAASVLDERAEELVAMDEALERLAALDTQKARVVELRFLGGLTSEEVGKILGVSTRTVERDWRFARAWLRREIGES